MSHATELASQTRTAKRPVELADDLTSDLVQTSFPRLVDKGKGTIDRFIMELHTTSHFSVFMKKKKIILVKRHFLIWVQESAVAAARRRI